MVDLLGEREKKDQGVQPRASHGLAVLPERRDQLYASRPANKLPLRLRSTQARAPRRRAPPRAFAAFGWFFSEFLLFPAAERPTQCRPRATRGLWNLSLRGGTLELSGYRCANELPPRPGERGRRKLFLFKPFDSASRERTARHACWQVCNRHLPGDERSCTHGGSCAAAVPDRAPAAG